MSNKPLTLENTRLTYVYASNQMQSLESEKVRIERERREYLKECEATFNLKYAEKLEEISNVRDAYMKASANYRQEVLASYLINKNKQVDEYASIRVTNKLKYEAESALEWCKSHNLALDYNKKSFEKFVKSSDTPNKHFPFVTVIETETVVIKLANTNSDSLFADTTF